MGREAVHTVDAASFYWVRQQMVTDHEQSLYLTEGEKEYWRRHEAQTPYAYYWDMGPSMILSSFRALLVFPTLMIGMVFSGVFADEHMRKTDQLVLYAENWNAPIQMYLESSPFALTLGEGIVILMALALLAAVLHSILTLVLSGWTKSGVAVISLMVVYVMGTMLVHVPERLRPLSQGLYLLPAKLVCDEAFYDTRLVGGAGHYLNCWQAGMLLYPLLALGLALLGGRIYRRWQISGR